VDIVENLQGTIQETEMREPTLSLGNCQQPTMTPAAVAPVPVKRARFSFPAPTAPLRSASTTLRLRNQNQSPTVRGKLLPPGTAPTLSSTVAATSRDGKVQLQILAQPEEQHRGELSG